MISLSEDPTRCQPTPRPRPSYFHATRAYLNPWDKPVAFCSDKGGVRKRG